MLTFFLSFAMAAGFSLKPGLWEVDNQAIVDGKKVEMPNKMHESMKSMPKEQQEMLRIAVEKNPELFSKIAKEIEQVKKTGKPEMYAALDVMKKYQKELQSLFQK